jgi:rod shape-determining protein MreD
MGRYVGIPLLIVAAILDATLMAELRIGGGAPDLVFLLVVSWALLANMQEALLWAVIGGVCQDALSLVPMGTSALGLVVVVFLSDTLVGQVRRANWVMPPLVAAAGTVVYHLGILAVLRLTGYALPIGEALVYVTVPTVLYNLILILPMMRAVGLLHQWLTPRRVRLE